MSEQLCTSPVTADAIQDEVSHKSPTDPGTSQCTSLVSESGTSLLTKSDRKLKSAHRHTGSGTSFAPGPVKCELEIKVC